jgi:rhodanese-related sulfurtransferase
MEWYTVVIAVALGLLLGWIMTQRNKRSPEAVHMINEEDFFNNMRKGQLVDVRKAKEFEQDKIKGARNFSSIQLTGKFPKVRKDKSVYLYCKNGRKSKKIANKMSGQGFKAVYVLEGGFNTTKK